MCLWECLEGYTSRTCRAPVGDNYPRLFQSWNYKDYGFYGFYQKIHSCPKDFQNKSRQKHAKAIALIVVLEMYCGCIFNQILLANRPESATNVLCTLTHASLQFPLRYLKFFTHEATGPCPQMLPNHHSAFHERSFSNNSRRTWTSWSKAFPKASN